MQRGEWRRSPRVRAADPGRRQDRPVAMLPTPGARAAALESVPSLPVNDQGVGAGAVSAGPTAAGARATASMRRRIELTISRRISLARISRSLSVPMVLLTDE